MQLIQEFVMDNEDEHMEEKSYGFRVIAPLEIERDLDYDFSEEYDIMIIKKLPKGFEKT